MNHLLNADEHAAAATAARDALPLAPPGTETAAWSAATAARASNVRDDGEAPSLAERARREAVALDLPGAEAEALVSLSVLAARAGRRSESDALLTTAVERARTTGSVSTEVRARYCIAATHYEHGEVDAAVEACRRAVARCAELGVTWSPFGLEVRALLVTALHVADAWAESARAAALAGDRPPDAAAARLQAASLLTAVASGSPSARDRLRALESAWHHDRMIALLAGAHEAELLRWDGRPREALAVLDRIVGWLDDPRDGLFLAGIWVSALGLGAAGDLAQEGRLLHDDQARAVAASAAERFLERARATARDGMPWRSDRLGPEGRAWLARAEAEHARASGHDDPEAWAAAREAFAYGHRYEQARCAAGLAEALAGLGRREEAAAPLREALTETEALGAAPLRASLEVLARRTRLELPAQPRSTSGGLTRREGEVLGLLAEGRTNRQIGEALFMSEKTASVHVSRILAELGASGRTEAVSLAHRRGLLTAAGS